MKAKKGKQTGAKYFQTTKKGEVAELKSDLNSLDRDKVKEAVKKVIASMTVGKDVSGLFTDVVKSMQTTDIELKKLVYLYIINYARHQPDKAILVVNTFQKDAKDNNPLIRALSIRTMGCIRVDKITEYLCEPLKNALKDKDPYVRKTACVAVAKLHDINSELVEEQDFIEILREMISDANPMVVANAVASLAEISETSQRDVLQLNSNMLSKLMNALNECTEWGQVFILDMLAKYVPSSKEAESIIERILPRLQHANSAVSMSAVKVILRYMDFTNNHQLEGQLVKSKLPPPLITLLSGTAPEIQYVALRNINLVIQKRPAILQQSVRHFFCKYNDPVYVKLEKLEIMVRLCDDDNIEQVLLELREYASEVDVEFVRRSIRVIGRCAIKLEKAAEKCIRVLLELIKTKVNYVVQEAIIVIKDIFRRYPNRYESVIGTLCENLDSLDEPEARASMIWIIGEYASRIENAPSLLQSFVEQFQDDPVFVRLQILTATVKVFLRRPDDAKELVQKVLGMATESIEYPDLRDRGYIYWRLLSTDPEAAQKIVIADKPIIHDDIGHLSDSVLNELISHMSSLASVYHKPPETFIKGAKTIKFTSTEGGGRGNETDSSTSGSESGEEEESPMGNNGEAAASKASHDVDDEDEEENEVEEKKSAPPKNQPVDLLGGFLDELGMTSTATVSVAAQSKRTIVLPEDNPKVKGLQIRSEFVRQKGVVTMLMTVENRTGSPLTNFAMKLNKNFFGLTPGPVVINGTIATGASAEASVTLKSEGAVDPTCKPDALQVAIKTDVGVAIFTDTLPCHLMFQENGDVGKKAFLEQWKAISDSQEQSSDLSSVASVGMKKIQSVLEANNLFTVAQRSVEGKGEVVYLSLKIKDEVVLIEVTIGNASQVCAKSSNPVLAKASLLAITQLLKNAN